MKKLKKSRFTEIRIVAAQKEVDEGKPVKEICRQHGIGDPTDYKWKSKYVGMEASDLTRVRELETENSRHMCLHADMALENAAMKD